MLGDTQLAIKFEKRVYSCAYAFKTSNLAKLVCSITKCTSKLDSKAVKVTLGCIAREKKHSFLLVTKSTGNCRFNL